MPILLSDPRVSAMPVRDTGDPMVPLAPSLRSLPGTASCRPGSAAPGYVRRGLAVRLERAQRWLPRGVRLRVVEGHRAPQSQSAIIAAYRRQLRRHHPAATAAELDVLTSRFVAPLAVAPHVAGAAVDLTLVDARGRELDLGTPVDATPEESAGACYTAAVNISPVARANRTALSAALAAEGLVNYPTEWWHWSYGDRYWALVTGAPAALYGPVSLDEVAA